MGENESLSNKEKLIKLINSIENEDMIIYLERFISNIVKAGN